MSHVCFECECWSPFVNLNVWVSVDRLSESSLLDETHRFTSANLSLLASPWTSCPVHWTCCVEKLATFITYELKSVKERMFCGVTHFFQGYFSELDNSELSHLIPLALQNKRDVLFGNLPEIYDFHNRYGPLFVGYRQPLLLIPLRFIIICWILECGSARVSETPTIVLWWGEKRNHKSCKCVKVTMRHNKQWKQGWVFRINCNKLDRSEGWHQIPSLSHSCCCFAFILQLRHSFFLLCPRTFLRELENCVANPEMVGTCFLKRVSVADGDLYGGRHQIFVWRVRKTENFPVESPASLASTALINGSLTKELFVRVIRIMT